LDHQNLGLGLVLKILYAAYSCLSLLISVQFGLEMCFAAQNRQKIHKILYFGVRGHQAFWCQSKACVRLPISD